MSDNKNALFTESFEQVFTTFYDEANEAVAGPSRSSSSVDDEIPVFASSALKESVQAIVDEFQTKIPSPKTPEEDSKDLVETRNQFQPTSLKHQAQEAAKKRSPPKSTEVVDKLFSKQLMEQATGKPVVLRTINPSHVIDFEWSVENFSKYVDDMYSCPFSGDNCRKMWQAHIALSTIISMNVELIELFFILDSSFQGKIQAYFNLGIYNSKGYEFGKWKKIVVFSPDCKRHSCFKTVRPPDCESSEKIKLDDDEFIIKGRIGFIGCCESTQAVDQPRLDSGTDTIKPI